MFLLSMVGLSDYEKLKDDFKVLYLALLSITVTHALFIVLFYWLAIPQLAAFNVFSLLTYVYTIRLFYQSVETSNFNAIGTIISIEVIAHAFIVSYYIGVDSGFHYYIFGLAAFPFVFVTKTFIMNAIRILIFVFCFVALEVYMQEMTPIVSLNKSLLEWMRYANITLLLLLVGSITLAYSQAMKVYQGTLTSLALTDKLTGIHNRRSLMIKAETEILKSKNSGEPLSILLIDIDYFKMINDTYGHLCGDYILSNIAQVMQTVLRRQDVIGRWGGEEFMVLLPNANQADLDELAERLRLTVAQAVFDYKGSPISVSVTIGAATFINNDSFDSLTTRADTALYEGKEGGRNLYRFAAA